MTATNNAISLIPHYKRLDNNKRYTIVTGGRGSGKSFHVSVWCLVQTYQKNQVILFTRYTMISAHDSIIPEFIDKIETLGLEGVFKITKTKIINKYTGSCIIFRGIKTSSGNQTAKLKSIAGLTCWILDEAEELPNKITFDKIDDSIRTKGATNKVMLVLNPTDKQHWIYKHFIKERMETVEYIHTTYLDNLRNLDKSFVAKAESAKRSDPDFYANNYLGEWGTLRDAVFPNGYTLYENEPSQYDWKIYGGDFGYSNDPTVLVQITKHGNEIYIKQLIYENGLLNKDISNKMETGGWNDELSCWDTSPAQNVYELRALGINAVPCKKGFVYVRLEKIKQFKLYLHKESLQMIEEFDSARWDKNDDGTFKRNTHDHLIMREDNPKKDHALDAIGYGLSFYIDMTGL